MKFSINQFVDRVIIIDDTREDADNLRELLESLEISCDVFSPDTIDGIQFHKNRQLIFCDLRLNENAQDSTAASALIRKILSECVTDEFGAYGLILWTNHEEDVEDVKEKLSIDRRKRTYNTPIFVSSLSKLEYRAKNSYKDVIQDLNDKLENDVAAFFFLTWGASVKKGFNTSTCDMYSLVDGYQTQSERIRSTLLLLGQNYTGIPDEELNNYAFLSDDAYKSVNEILCADLYNAISSGYDLFKGNYKFEENDQTSRIKSFSFINTKLFISTEAMDQKQIIPGNVYNTDILSPDLKLKNIPKKSTSVAIELTPPCDYSHKKVLSRLVIGFMIECPDDNDSLFDLIRHSKPDYRYAIWPILFDSTAKFLCFDFRHLVNIDSNELKDPSKFKLLFRLNHNLFADVIQKFSSHAARIGESLLKPELVDPQTLIETTNEQKLVQSLKSKLKSGTVNMQTFKQMIKGKFDFGKDEGYLKILLNKNGIAIDGEILKLNN